MLVLASFWCDTALAYKIHAQKDTVFVHAKRGFWGQPSNLDVISSRRGEDTATYLKQGWDTIRVSLSGDSEFSWSAAWETVPMPFLGDRGLYLKYSPTSLVPSQVIVTVVGDSNTIQIVVIGIPDTNYTCVKFASGKFPALAEGQSGLVFDTIYNLTDSALVIDSVKMFSGDTNMFAIVSPSFPQTVAPNSGSIVSLRSTVPSPAIKTFYGVNMHIWDHGTSSDGAACVMANGSNSGPLLIPEDTIVLDLPPTSADTLALSVKAAITRHRIVIRNSSGSRIYITSIQITDTSNQACFPDPYGPHCRFGNGTCKNECLDDTVASSATSDTILLQLQEPDSGTYSINLQVNYSNALQSQKYTIQAHYARPAAWVQPAVVPMPLEFSLNPNPAHSEVTILLPPEVSSTVEIYDVLGHLLFHRQAVGQLTWNESASGETASTASYIVRVARRMTDGSMVSSSKRLVFIR